jgi:FkbM family methyltransferase
MRMTNRWIKRLFRAAGLDLRRAPSQYMCHVHAFPDQRVILAARPPGVILDVGANVGQSVVRYRWLFPDAVIHSFEPHPQAFDQLTRQIAGDERAHAWPLAMSDQPGSVRFHANRLSDTSSMLPTRPDLADDRNLGTESVLAVRATTVDQFCHERGIARASILKLDVQGGEARVLAGANGLLGRQAFDLVLTEVWFDSPYVDAPHFTEIDATLRGHGYRFYGLYFGPHQNGNHLIFTADAIYLSRAATAALDPACSATDRHLAARFVDRFGD